MAPKPRIRPLAGAILAVAVALAAASSPSQALRIVNYNVTNYPSVLFPQRQPYFRTVMAPLGPDIVTCQEFLSQAGVDSFRTNVLNVLEPGQWLSAPFVNGNDTDNAFFYKPSKVQFLGMWTFYPNPANLLRLVACYRVKPVGYSAASAEIRIYSQHLKASSGSTNVAQRLAEATGIRDSMNAIPPGTHAILLGDFNIYTTTEPAFQKFLESQADNDGRLYDPFNLSGTFNVSGYAPYHTQCPCLTCPTGSGFSGGGLDDRFDMFLPTYNMNDGEGLDLLVSTYKPVGNDGLHYNLNITDPPTIPEGAAYASALWNASDHLPIRVDIQLPAQISVAASLDFGTVIVGYAASQDLSITNPAAVPADGLDYSFTAPAGFGAPGGSFTLAAGAPAALQAITMSTGSAGTPSGNLSIASDDPDHPTTLVALSGTVLDHAQASLDSIDALAADTLDFGDHEGGTFTTLLARVHNRGYDAQHARLSVTAGAITGGDSRFSIVGGFSPALVSGTAQSYEVAFDDNGATQDSTYYATLTFTSADEPLPGAASQPDLVVTLRARRTSGTVAVGERGIPDATRLYNPFPNPVTGASTLRFDLARGAPEVRLDVFDLRGRRVATIADRAFDPGRYRLDWSARDASGRPLGAGLYFVRLSAPGLVTRSARLAIVR
ncbi:MAG TPA: choice-of-anchor D domain-containing protein [Candidatus Eisenbacteria bacterium]|jgi:hypothetical protein